MKVPPEVLSTLTKHTDSESSRYALGGVRLERDGDKGCAVATDGRRLILAEWTDETDTGARVPDFATILAAGDCKAIAKMGGKPTRGEPRRGQASITEASVNGRVPVEVVCPNSGRVQADFASMEGRFPRWRDVVPKFGEPYCRVLTEEWETRDTLEGVGRGDYVRVDLDPRYLAEACDAARRLSTSAEAKGVSLYVPVDGAGAVVVKSPATHVSYRAVETTAVLMPLARDR